ncbi:MAG: AAA family ATPase [Chloroflexota bacterium]
MKLYSILGNVHLALITVGGLISIVGVLCLFDTRLFSGPTSLLFLLAYVVCDLIRITFLYGATISLGFPLILLTLVTDSPLAASFVAIFGSLFSEGLYGRFVSKQRLPLAFVLRRAFFYAGHHALASTAASLVYYLTYRSTPPWVLETLHLQAIAAYVVVYALLSMLFIWPHDFRVHRILAPDEDRFVRINLITPLLFIPPTAAVYYLYNLNIGQTAKSLIVVGIFPPLLLFLFYLARQFTRSEDDRTRLQIEKSARDKLGSPASMAEMVQRVFDIAGQLITYRWAAIYERKGKDLVLLATRRGRERPVVWDSETGNEENSTDEIASAEQGEVGWPTRIRLGEGYLGKMARVFRAQPFFSFEGSLPVKSFDLCLPPRTALIPFPIAVREHTQGEQGHPAPVGRSPRWRWRLSRNPHVPVTQGKQGYPTLVGLLALARPKRMFTIIDQERGQLLSNQTGNVLLSVQRLVEALHQLYQRTEAYARDPEKVRQAMRELLVKQVDVSQILSVVAERSFRNNWQTVLRGVVEERKESELSLSQRILEDIYRQVRDETPGMPPLTPDILRLLQTVTSSLSLAFSLPYQWPDMRVGIELKELYQLLLSALEANTIPRIVALDSLIATRVEEFEKKPPEVQGGLPMAAVSATRKLRQIIDELKKAQMTQELTDQRSDLSRALNQVVEQEREVREDLRDPERLILLQVLSGWRTTITTALEELAREPARLALSLRSNRALPLEEIIVALVLKNEGPAAAYRVEAQLQPGPNYEVSGGKSDLGTLPAGKVEEFEFTLRIEGEGPLRLEFCVTYDDSERRGKIEQFADLLYLSESPSSFIEIDNPYTPGLPLKPENPTFVGREDDFKFIRQNVAAVVQRAVLVLIGERRTGKTSILQQLEARLGDPRYIPVYVDGNGLGIDPGIGNLFLSFAEAIADGLKRVGMSIPRLTLEELGESPQHVFERRFLPQVREQIGARTLLMCVDEFEELGARVRSGSLPPSVFPALRHLMQHGEQLAFIFAGTHKIENLMEDYWSVLFNVARYRRVGFLGRDATVRLVTEPVQAYGMRYDDLALEEIWRLTAGHPYFTQMLCNILVNQCNDEKRNYVTIQDVRHALDEVLEGGQAHLSYIWQTSDRETRLCLAVLAELQTRVHQISASAIANRLGDFQVALDTGRITQIMETLRAREIVLEVPGNPVTYDFAAQLYKHWLLRYKSLGKVVEENGNAAE